MKKSFFLLSCFVLCSSFSCSSKKERVSLFLYNETDPFIGEMVDEVNSLLSHIYNVDVHYASSKQSIQNIQVDEALKKGTSVVIMNMVDRLASRYLIEKCQAYETPIFFFNREPLLEDLKLSNQAYYVGINPNMQGELQATAIAKDFGNPKALNPLYDSNSDNIIQLLLLKGEQGHQDAEGRTKISIQRLKDMGYKIEILETSICNWNRDEGYEALKKIGAERYSDFEMILSNNDEMAIGAINWVLENKLKIIPTYGVDATHDGRDYVNKGYMKATIINDSKKQAKAIQQVAQAIINEIDPSTLDYTISNERYIYIDGSIYYQE